ncbi:MAG: hypothetical protein H0T48_17660 [Gemmatimonadaceae bacterium]|nr:hypothetical protein [Gemmatimonadaceae bacterium]
MTPGLTLQLIAPATVRRGRRIPFKLRVGNASDTSLDLYLRGREPTFDIVVTDAEGARVWRRLEGAVIPAVLRVLPMRAGEVLVLKAGWDQRGSTGEIVESGDYLVTAILLTDAADPPSAGQHHIRVQ